MKDFSIKNITYFIIISASFEVNSKVKKNCNRFFKTFFLSVVVPYIYYTQAQQQTNKNSFTLSLMLPI